MKKIILMFLLLIVPIVIASPLNVTITKITDEVDAGGRALFTLSIRNDQIRTDTFQVVGDDLSVYPFSDFAYSIQTDPGIITINSGETKNASVSVIVMDDVKPNRFYITNVKIFSVLYDARLKVPLELYVVPSESAVKITTSFKELIPGVETDIPLTLQSKVAIPLKLELKINSEVFSKTDNLELEPFDVKTLNIPIKVDTSTAYGDYNLIINLYQDQKIKGQLKTTIKVLENPNIKEERTVKSSLFSRAIRIIKTNIGNVEYATSIIYPVTNFERMFTYADYKKSILKTENGYDLKFDLSLRASESKTIIIMIDYKPLWIVIVLILIVIALLYYYLRPAIRITKKAFKFKKDKDGLIEIKVMLHVKNTSNKTTKDVKVIDLLPRMVKPVAEFGTLKPVKVQKSLHGIRFIWEIPLLEKHSERVISYVAKSALPVIGTITLPSASIQYTDAKGKVMNIISNKGVVSSE